MTNPGDSVLGPFRRLVSASTIAIVARLRDAAMLHVEHEKIGVGAVAMQDAFCDVARKLEDDLAVTRSFNFEHRSASVKSAR